MTFKKNTPNHCIHRFTNLLGILGGFAAIEWRSYKSLGSI